MPCEVRDYFWYEPCVYLKIDRNLKKSGVYKDESRMYYKEKLVKQKISNKARDIKSDSSK